MYASFGTPFKGTVKRCFRIKSNELADHDATDIEEGNIKNNTTPTVTRSPSWMNSIHNRLRYREEAKGKAAAAAIDTTHNSDEESVKSHDEDSDDSPGKASKGCEGGSSPDDNESCENCPRELGVKP
jgi:hypothetical protein